MNAMVKPVEKASIVKISDDAYFATEALSVSVLKEFAKAPAKAHLAKETTAAMQMGSLVHCAILEPECLEQRYTPTSLDRRGTKAWTAEKQAAGGRELIKRDDYDDALRMRDAVWAHPTASKLLKNCKTEQACFWHDPDTGIPCKAKADALNYEFRIPLDVKTTADASKREFERQFARMKYDWQDIFYRVGFSRAGFRPEGFVFIAIEKEPPYLIGIYELDENQLTTVYRIVMEQVAKYAECIKNQYFPGYDPAIQTITLPRWALGE